MATDIDDDFPPDALVVVGEQVLVSQLSTSGEFKLSWTPLPVEQSEAYVVKTKLRMMGSMLMDDVRNRAYEEAIRTMIRPGDVVLDAGAGTGLLSMMAARHGASKVYACEMNEHIAQVASRIVKANQLQDIVRVLPFRTTDVHAEVEVESEDGCCIPRKVDLIVSETMDSILTTEGMIQTLRDARERLGSSDCRVIPCRGTMFGRIVELRGAILDLYQASAAHRDPVFVHAFDCQRVNENVVTLTQTFSFFSLDFGRSSVGASSSVMEDDKTLKTVQAGHAHALLMWWSVDLCDSVSLSTGPEAAAWQDHWHQTLLFFPASVSAAKDEDVNVHLKLNIESGKVEADLAHSGKRLKQDEQDASSRMDRNALWMSSRWKGALEESLKGLNRATATKPMSLLDLSEGSAANQIVRGDKLSTFIPLHGSTVPSYLSKGAMPLVVSFGGMYARTCGQREIDAALLFLYRCANITPVPSYTLPAQAFVKCALVHFNQLENPLLHLQSVAGFDHHEMFTGFSANMAPWAFPLSLYNYEYQVTSERDLTVTSLDFAKCELQFSEANAELVVCRGQEANAVVFWVRWAFPNCDQTLELASPLNPEQLHPSAYCEVQFLDRIQPELTRVTVSCSLDSITNRLVYTCATSPAGV